MGQKVNPNGIRIGYIKNWNSVWYADKKDYSDMLNTDIRIRNFLFKKLHKASVSKICIERPTKNAKITIYSSRPGIIIGKKGEDIEKLRKKISSLMGGISININIEEIRKPELEAKLVAENISYQLEKRMMFRRVMKRSVQNTMKAGAKGMKVSVSGRLSGAEIARTESYREGRVPLHTFRANINYSFSIASTPYGILGIKVWIFTGYIHKEKKNKEK